MAISTLGMAIFSCAEIPQTALQLSYAAHMATHTAAPQEDLGTILKRFQQWTGEPGRPIAGKDSHESVTDSHGFAQQAHSMGQQMTRELSYDEAISRARRRARHPWEDEDLAKATPSTAASHPLTEVATGHKAVTDGVRRSSSGRRQIPSAPKTALKTAASSGTDGSRSSTRRRETKSVTASGAAAAATARRSTKTSTGRKNAKQAASPTGENFDDGCIEKSAAPAVAYDLQPLPSFQQVLAAQMKASSVSSPAAVTPVIAEAADVPVEEISGAAVAVTVHLSVTERNALRNRAQQLGLSPGAYLRQCALEVESLRSELQELLVARMQASRQLPPEPRRGWFGRMKQYFVSARGDCQTQIFRA